MLADINAVRLRRPSFDVIGWTVNANALSSSVRRAAEATRNLHPYLLLYLNLRPVGRHGKKSTWSHL